MTTGTTAGGLVGGRYSLGEQLGLGGMGRVYRARDRVLDRDVAIKLLDEAADADVGPACASEARAAARLSHPGIAGVFDSGVHDGRPFVAMELISGRPLDRILRDGPRPGPLEAAELAARVADALEYAHRQGVVHCDVKPQNIVVAPDGRPKLVDFGIARVMSTTGAPAPEEIRGSAPYIAPEQVRGERVDGRADVYALGAVLYEVLTGRPPFQGPTVAAIVAQHLAGDLLSPRALNPNVSPELQHVVLTALARDRSDRYARAGDLRDALRHVVSTEQAAARARTERVEHRAPTAVMKRRGRAVPSRGTFGKRAPLIAVGVALLAACPLLALSLFRPVAGPGFSTAAPPVETPQPPPRTPEPAVPPMSPSASGGSVAPPASVPTPAPPSGTNDRADQGGGNQPSGGNQPTVGERTREDQKKADERAREDRKKAEEQAREDQKKREERAREDQKKAEEQGRGKRGGRE